MKRSGTHTLTLTCLLFVVLPLSSFAQELERALQAIDSRYALIKPSRVDVSPNGSSFVVVDPLANHLYVFHSTGELSWAVGEGTSIILPTAACFDGEDALLFALQGQKLVLRVEAVNPLEIDTVADLAKSRVPLHGIDCLKKAPDNTFLVMDRGSGQIYRFDDQWNSRGIIVPHGQGRGRVWSPIDFAVDLAGNIIVTDEANIPVQVFSPSGKFLFQAGWNNPAGEKRWQAGGVAVSNEEIVWVADNTNAHWRLYGPTGNEIEKRAYDQQGLLPMSMVFTLENQLIVIDQRGPVSVYRVP